MSVKLADMTTMASISSELSLIHINFVGELVEQSETLLSSAGVCVCTISTLSLTGSLRKEEATRRRKLMS